MEKEEFVMVMREMLREELREELKPMKEDIATLKADVGTLKADVGTLKSDVSTLKSDMKWVKAKLNSHEEMIVDLTEFVKSTQEDRFRRLENQTDMHSFRMDVLAKEQHLQKADLERLKSR